MAEVDSELCALKVIHKLLTRRMGKTLLDRRNKASKAEGEKATAPAKGEILGLIAKKEGYNG